MAFYITGDVHGDHDIRKFSRTTFIDGKNLTENDYIFICGDFGLVWYENDSKLEGRKTQDYWIKWLEKSFPRTKILVTLGNHENYDIIETLPKVEMFGDVVRKLNNQIYIFERGHVYTIENKKILSLSGAKSIDKNWRLSIQSEKTGKLWWEQELWTTSEQNHCLDILDRHNWTVDYVISHTAPEKMIYAMFNDIIKYGFDSDPTGRFFDHILDKPLNFKSWWFGHWHEDRKYNDYFICSYHNIHKVEI